MPTENLKNPPPGEHSKPRREQTVAIAAGGTGGHIFPALAVAESLLALSPGLKIHLIHSGKCHGAEDLVKAGAPWTVHSLPTGALGSGSSAFVRFMTLVRLPLVIIRAALLLRRLRPRAVLGCGGAVSGPVLTAAFLLKIRQRALWEGNSSLGLTNRLLLPFTQKVIAFFPDLPLPRRAEKKRAFCGYPLRKSFAAFLKQREESADSQSAASGGAAASLPKRKFSVLILGGSQGSSLLNRAVSEAVSNKDDDWRRDVFVFHQTGKRDFSYIKERYKKMENAEAFAFSSSIEEYYEKSDLIFSRAGAGVTAEIAALGKALVFVPIEKAAGGHQLKNALSLQKAAAALYIPEKEWSSERFRKEVLRLKNDEALRSRLAQNIRKLHKPGGAREIARLLLDRNRGPAENRS